jgi:uncharacterized membrane protein YhaH (DUF805 family)
MWSFIEKLEAYLAKNFIYYLVFSYLAAIFTPQLGQFMGTFSLGQINWPAGQHLQIFIPLAILALLLFNAGLGVKLHNFRKTGQHFFLLIGALLLNSIWPLVFILGISQAFNHFLEFQQAQIILLSLALIVSMPIAGSPAAQLEINPKMAGAISGLNNVDKIIKLKLSDKLPSVLTDQAAAEPAIGIETIKAKLSKMICAC